MKTHRCFHDALLTAGDHITPSEAEAHHLLRVRRARAGDRILVINGRGAEFDARIIETSARSLSLELLDTNRVEKDAPAFPVLAPALTPDTDTLVSMAVELGVGGFRPLLSARCTVRGAGKRPGALAERWRRLAIAAIKQCERLWLPVIHEPASVAEALDDILAAEERPICLTERVAGLRSLVDCLDSVEDAIPAIMVGPEGGWDQSELKLFADSGVERASMGNVILRAETACVAALATSLAHRAADRA